MLSMGVLKSRGLSSDRNSEYLPSRSRPEPSSSAITIRFGSMRKRAIIDWNSSPIAAGAEKVDFPIRHLHQLELDPAEHLLSDFRSCETRLCKTGKQRVACALIEGWWE